MVATDLVPKQFDKLELEAKALVGGPSSCLGRWTKEEIEIQLLTPLGVAVGTASGCSPGTAFEPLRRTERDVVPVIYKLGAALQLRWQAIRI
jgi:hypothetical protein